MLPDQAIVQFKNEYHPRRVLAAVSGGPDSMAMLYALRKNGVQCVVAHCNFNLRGAESDEDERFVLQSAQRYRCDIETIRFDTVAYARSKGISIEMAAREMRYDWFEQIAQKHACDYICVAHNADDAIETFFLNLVRGTGLNGLTGMRAVAPVLPALTLARPLLEVKRDEIMSYIKQEKLVYRVDSTNEQTIYKRNYIRHEILPALGNLNVSFKDTMRQNMQHLSQASEIVTACVNDFVAKHVVSRGETTTIDRQSLIASPGAELILFELLKPLKFAAADIDEIYLAAQDPKSQLFHSATHALVVTKNAIEIRPKHDSLKAVCVSSEALSAGAVYTIQEPVTLAFTVKSAPQTIIKKEQVAQLDYDKLHFPLTVRAWQAGDWFIPFGMKGRKKISDFLLEKKINRLDKENICVVESGGCVAWVVGLRIDARYALTDSTKTILEIHSK